MRGKPIARIQISAQIWDFPRISTHTVSIGFPSDWSGVMTFLSRLTSFRLPTETIRKFLTIALIAPLLQIGQIAAPTVASAAQDSQCVIGSSLSCPATSPQEIYNLYGTATDGRYFIKANGVATEVYLKMNRTRSDNGAWVLLMKGARGTTNFNYESTNFTSNTTTLNVTSLADDVSTDAKFSVYNTLSIAKLLAVLKSSAAGTIPADGDIATNSFGGHVWLEQFSPSTAYTKLMSSTNLNNNSGNVSYTNVPATKWKTSAGAQVLSYQDGFGVYGFNQQLCQSSNYNYRWGIAWNQEPNWGSCDVVVGIGIGAGPGSSSPGDHVRWNGVTTGSQGGANGKGNFGFQIWGKVSEPSLGAPTSLAASDAGSGNINLSWGAPASVTPVDYVVQYKAAAAGSYSNSFIVSGQTSAAITGLTGGTAYNFRVFARTASNSTSSANIANSTIEKTPSTPPNAPTSVTAVPASNRATVSWVASTTAGAEVTGYVVTASNNATCVVNTPSLTRCTFAAGSLPNGVSYTFTVKANSSLGYGPSSDSTTGVVPNEFTLSYSANSGTGTPPTDSSSPYPTGDTVTVRANSNLAKTNYTFSGWNTKADGTGTDRAATGSATFAIDTNTVLYAKWAPVRYTLTYNANSGTGTPPSDTSSPYIFNSSVTVKTNSDLARTNYAFTGWNTRANGVGGNAYAATGAATFTIETNTVLYAQWAQYVLTYNSNSGSGLPPTSLTSGGVITLGGAGTLTRAGFYFDGWNTQADGLGSSYTATGSYTLTGVTTLYAKWSRYKITYDTGTATSGTVPLVQSGYGAVTLSSNSGSLAKADNYWDGWTRSSDGTGTKLSGSFDLSRIETLYPRWNKYTLSYNAGTSSSGTVPGSATGYGNKTTAQNDGSLAKTNFAFTGWNTASDGSGRYYAADSPINLDTNTVLYPYFAKFRITYETGTATSGSPPSPQLGAGSVALATNSGSLVRTNYYWDGWTTSRDGIGAKSSDPYTLTGNLTLYPRWSQYTITYDMTGNTTAGTPFTTSGFGNTALAGSAPGYAKTSATLGGWTTGPSGTGDFYNLGATFNITDTSTRTLYAKWLTLAGSTLTITNPTFIFPLYDGSNNFQPGRVAIRVTETAGSHSTRSFTVSVTGTNCSSEGSAVTTNDLSTAGGTLDSGFFVKASGIASCSVTITRPSDSSYGASTNTQEFQFYPKNQVTPLLVATDTPTANVGTPIPLSMLGSNRGDGNGAVSYAAYGNNCFITTSGSDYFLNATLPTTCKVIVTRAAWQQWAIATSQTAATFTFVALAQTGFTVTSKSVPFGTTVSLFTTGGNGNGAVSYTAFGSGCAIASVNQLTAANAGNCTVVANKSASGAYKGQTSAPAVFTFTPISQSPITITDNSLAANAISTNVITLGIRGGTGSGAVSFAAASTPGSNCQITRIDSFTATLSATATGKCTVTAYKSASNGYTGITSSPASYSFGVAPPNNLVLVSAGGVTSTLLTDTINLRVTGQVVGGGAITFARFNNNSCSFTNIDTATGTATLKSTAVGSCNVQVTQAASGAYLSASSGLVTFTFTGGVQSPLSLAPSLPDTSTTTLSGSTMHMVTTGGSGSGTFSYSVQSLNGANCGAVVPANPSDTATSLATISSSSPGICQVTVVKSGDSLYGYISKTTNFTFVGIPQPTLTLSASPTKAPALSNVLVTLSGGSGGGAVTFTVTGGCTPTSQSGSNTVSITASSPTSCYVSATKAADGTIASATTYPGLVVTFTKAVQSNLVTNVDNATSDYENPRSANRSYLISTTGGSGSGVVTFAAYGNGNCKLDTSTAGIAILTSAFQTATCSVVASKGGDSIYGPVNAPAVSLSFTAAGQGEMTITGGASEAAVNANITLTVTGGNGSGALKFSANNSSGGNCVITPGNTDTTTVSRTVTSTTLGSCSVTVVKSASGIYSTKVATSSNFNFGSTQDPVTIIPETTTAAVAGEPYILVVGEGSRSGALTWYGGGCVVSNDYNPTTGRVTVRSDAEALTCNVSVIRSVAGYYPANSNVQAITFTPATQVALNIVTTPTWVTVGETPTATVNAGETITVTLSGGSTLGALNFALYQSGSDCTITKSGNTALVYRATAGNCSIQGLRSGDKKYRTVLSSVIKLVWGQRAQTIPLVISNDPTYASAGETITLTTVGGEGEGLVTFQVIGDYNPLCVLSGDRGQYLFKAAYGTCMIRATKAATLVYAQQRSQNIVFTFFGTTAQIPLAIDESVPTASLGSTISLSTTGGSVPVTASYVITGGTGTGTITGTTLSATSAGTLTVVATKQGNNEYASVVSPPATFTFTG